MPEGPEIRRAADRVERAVAGHVAERIFFGLPRLKRFEDELSGRRVERVETRGKAMLTWFEGEMAVYSHNQLYGRWMICKHGERPKTGRSLRFAIVSSKKDALLYSASDIEVLAAEEVPEHPFLKRLGPDLLSEKGWGAAQLRSRLLSKRFRNRGLSSLLLDQAFVAGLGNYLRSEILFVGGVRPGRRPAELETDEVAAVAAAIATITRRAYKTGGITTDEARVREAKAEGVPRRGYRHYVFAREGRACRVCGTPVERVDGGGRRVFFCPQCQR